MRIALLFCSLEHLEPSLRRSREEANRPAIPWPSLRPAAAAANCHRKPLRGIGELRCSLSRLMCKSKSDTHASEPRPRTRSRLSSTTVSAAAISPGGFPTRFGSDPGLLRASPLASNSVPSPAYKTSSSSSSSLSTLREALPKPLVVYSFSELCSATGNFLSNRLPRSSGWRCSLRGEDVVVFQRRFRGPDPGVLPVRLAALSRSHHSSLVRLLGASVAGDHVYLVHEFVPGASLDDCLHNSRNLSFTPLSTWVSRMQIASDLAHGLEYIHLHSAAGIHNRFKGSSIIVTEPEFRARICHFGAADLAGEVAAAPEENGSGYKIPPGIRKTGSRGIRIEGSRDYMAPELLVGGSISRRSDVFAFGVVLLELISGRKPRNRWIGSEGAWKREQLSLIGSAREAIGSEEEEEARPWRVRQWVDSRLRDSFPVDTVDALIQVALRCVEVEAAARPDMLWIAGVVSKLFVDSQAWAESIKHATEISVTVAPR